MTTDGQPAFKVTWPATEPRAPAAVRDLDLKRPGTVDPRTRAAVLRGAVPGPAAGPGRRGRLRRDGG